MFLKHFLHFLKISQQQTKIKHLQKVSTNIKLPELEFIFILRNISEMLLKLKTDCSQNVFKKSIRHEKHALTII